MRTNLELELLDKVDSYEAFLNSLLDPEGFGWQVTEEVRDCARVLLGIPPVLTKTPTNLDSPW